MSTTEFNEMLLNNAGSLQPFAISLTRNHESAKDLFQETLYRALANRDKYNTGTNVKAWLFTIMKNIFINDYRRKAKQRLIFSSSSTETFVESSSNVKVNDGEQSIQLNEIRKAIHRLPEIFKTAFSLYFEGYHYYEIAESLNEPLGTIKSRIHFARKLLKEQLSQH